MFKGPSRSRGQSQQRPKLKANSPTCSFPRCSSRLGQPVSSTATSSQEALPECTLPHSPLIYSQGPKGWTREARQLAEHLTLSPRACRQVREPGTLRCPAPRTDTRREVRTGLVLWEAGWLSGTTLGPSGSPCPCGYRQALGSPPRWPGHTAVGRCDSEGADGHGFRNECPHGSCRL